MGYRSPTLVHCHLDPDCRCASCALCSRSVGVHPARNGQTGKPQRACARKRNQRKSRRPPSAEGARECPVTTDQAPQTRTAHQCGLRDRTSYRACILAASVISAIGAIEEPPKGPPERADRHFFSMRPDGRGRRYALGRIKPRLGLWPEACKRAIKSGGMAEAIALRHAGLVGLVNRRRERKAAPTLSSRRMLVSRW